MDEAVADATATASAHEIFLVVPDRPYRGDVYWMHQEVWAQVAARRIVRSGLGGPIKSTTSPSLLFHQDGPLVRVRVSGWALKNASTAATHLSRGAIVRVRARLGLWREWRRNIQSHETMDEANTQVEALLGRCGLRIDDRSRAAGQPWSTRPIELLQLGGSKWIKASADRAASGSHHIQVTAADIDLVAEVVDPKDARGAWLNGIGRAKRLGCGMLDLTPMIART